MKIRHIIYNSLLLIVSVLFLNSCKLVTDDLSDCPTGLYVNFVYDYNIDHADMFKDHVGAVTLYVYDESDHLVAQRTVSGSQLSVYGYNIHFTEEELAPGHQYRLTAIALQNDWDQQLSKAGAKYRHPEMKAGDERQKLSVTLDHQPIAASDYYEVPATAPLDTLWHTLATLQATAADRPAATNYHLNSDGSVRTNGVERVSLVSGEPTYATVSLIRDTNHLNLSLYELNGDNSFADVNDEDYEVFILDRNATVNCDNQVVTPGKTLIYRPYASWTTNYDGNGEIQNQQSAHYDLMFNRLMYSTTMEENAVLCVRKKSTGKDVVMINLPSLLCNARTYFEGQSYQPQEYLDREYDYRLEFFLKGDSWQYVSMHIHLLPYAIRIQNVTLD